jgi:hypothetical protein
LPPPDFDGTLRAGAAEAQFDLPPSRSVANMFHKALMNPGARLIVGGVKDVGSEELMEAWEAASPDNAASPPVARVSWCCIVTNGRRAKCRW